MMKKIIKIGLLSIAVMMFACLLSACDDSDDLKPASRLFRPIIKEYTVSGTWFTVEWERYEGALTFELEISLDSFQTILRSVETEMTEFTFEDLNYDTEYQLRIRSLGNNINSDYFIADNVTTLDYPTRLKTPSSADIIDKMARISWANAIYDSLLVFNGDSIVGRYELTEEDNLAGSFIVSKLDPLTSYIVRAYFEGNYMGKKLFKTVASENYGSDVIDLRDSVNVNPYILYTSVFNTITPEKYPNGVTIVLAGGKTYEMTTSNLTTNVHLVTGLSLEGYARMEVTGNFNVAAGVAAGNVTVEKIIFTDHPSKPKTSSNFGGTYLFNFNGAGCQVGDIVVKNCDIRYKRGLCRIQAATTIKSVTIDSCVIDSIGGYGILNLDHADAMITDMKITNSTLSHFDGYLCRAIKPTLSPNSIVVDHVTTCFAPATSRYFLELTGKTFPGGITITNNIFGQGLTSDATVHGLNSSCNLITIDKCFKTSDLVWIIAAGATEPTYPITCENLGLTSAEVFANPSSNDYTVTDSRLVKKAGDPRWW